MSNLKAGLKILPVLLLAVFVSCKKKDPVPEAFDIRDYTTIGKPAGVNPYVINLYLIVWADGKLEASPYVT